MTRANRLRGRLAGGLLLALAAGAGCSVTEDPVPDIRKPHEKTDNVLTGRVLINDTTPMPTGYVYVYRDGFKAPVAAGPIGRDGAYRVPDVPAGEIQLVVTPDASGVAPPYPGEPIVKITPPRPPPPTGRQVPATNAKKGPPAARKGRPKSPGRPGAPGRQLDLAPEVWELLAEVRQKYGDIAAPGHLVTTVQAGSNTYTIQLQVP